VFHPEIYRAWCFVLLSSSLFAMKYSSGTSTGAVNIEIKLPAISAIASP